MTTTEALAKADDDEQDTGDLRRLVLAACEDLGRYGLTATTDSVAAVASLVVNASRLGVAVDSKHPPPTADEWLAAAMELDAAAVKAGNLAAVRSAMPLEYAEAERKHVACIDSVRALVMRAAPSSYPLARPWAAGSGATRDVSGERPA